MASNDHKGSLPPIIEDESDDNLLPMLYCKELGRSKAGNNEMFSQSKSSGNDSESMSSSHLPYNSWKSRNASFLKKAGDSPDMMSKLGQTLESCQMILSPQTNESPQVSSQSHLQQETPNYHRVDVQSDSGSMYYNSRGFGENGKFFHSPCPIPAPKSFDEPFNYSQRGYFSPQNIHYQEQLYDNQRHFRKGGEGFSAPDQFKFQHTPERSYNPVRYPYSVASNQFEPQHIFSNVNLESPVYGRRGEYETSQSCQNNCCKSSRSNSNSEVTLNRHHEKKHSPQENGEYSFKNIEKLPPKPSPCHCHKQDFKDKKKDKLEKTRKKQITDLYRIVWLQNQQIVQLQNQMKNLLEHIEKSDERGKKLHDEHPPKSSKSTSEKRMFNLSVIEENQNLLEKVSVGIMTSFIDTTKTKRNKRNNKKVKDLKKKSHQPKSSESSSSTLSDSESLSTSEDEIEPPRNYNTKKNPQRKPHEDSLMLNGLEIQTIAENPPTPNSSAMQIDLHEFSDSSKSDESDTTESDSENQLPVGWTFYDKVVGKVNNMLNESESDDEPENNIRNKTVEQLKKLGISIVEEESPSSKRVTFESPLLNKPALPDSDTSMRMNALALKYLKEGKPSQDECTKTAEKLAVNNGGNTNLSYATLRYLERYHLIPKFHSNDIEKTETKKSKKKKDKKCEDEKTHKKKSKSSQHSGKILDITAIKQQPKLLPKKM